MSSRSFVLVSVLVAAWIALSPPPVYADTTAPDPGRVGTLSDVQVSEDVKRACRLKEGTVYRFFAEYVGDDKCPVPCITRYCVRTTETTPEEPPKPGTTTTPRDQTP